MKLIENPNQSDEKKRKYEVQKNFKRLGISETGPIERFCYFWGEQKIQILIQIRIKDNPEIGEKKGINKIVKESRCMFHKES